MKTIVALILDFAELVPVLPGTELVTELNGFDNLYFEVCNEFYERSGGTGDWSDQIIAAITDAEIRLPKKHLIAQGFPPSVAVSGLNDRVSMELPVAAYKAEWINTKTGQIEKIETFSHAGGDKAVASPEYSEDIALRVARQPSTGPDLRTPPAELTEFFAPPEQYRSDPGNFRSPLVFADGTRVQNPADWQRRREEILSTWQKIMGSWPPLIEKPRVEMVNTTRRENITQRQLRIEIALGGEMVDALLLVADGEEPAHKRPAVLLSALAYAAANAHTVLAQRAEVDPNRIGIVGHSFGGKWAMFASCLYDKFACAVWSDPGIVFDERDRRKQNPNGSVNYWDVWYLGFETGAVADPKNAGPFRKLPSEGQARTGAYKALVESGHDLVELHALMAPRPFLVSGGTADLPERWPALNHAIAVNKLLGYDGRVAMTTRDGHTPTEHANEQVYRFFEWWLKDRE